MSKLGDAYNRLNPHQPLDEEVLSACYVGRDPDPVAPLAESLAITTTPERALLIGQFRIGKSTELARLARMLDKKPVPHYLIPINPPPTEYLVGNVLADVVKHILKQHENAEGFPYGIFGWVPFVDVGIATKTERMMGKSSDPLARQQEKNLEGLNFLLTCVPKAENGLRPVLLLDGGEKLLMPVVQELLPTLRKVNVCIVLAVGASIYLQEGISDELQRWSPVVLLPAISVLTADGQLDEKGRDHFRAVIARRAGEDTFTAEALDALIAAGGGIHGEFVQLARDACRNALAREGAETVSLQDAQEAIEETRLTKGLPADPAGRDLLNRLAKGEDLTADLDQRVASLIDENKIVCYYRDWDKKRLAVHPLLLPLVRPSPEGAAR